MSRNCLCGLALAIISVVASVASAQENTAPKTAPAISEPSAAKFAFGKSIYVKNEHGNGMAFDVINSDIEGWGRFTILNLPDKADLIAEVTTYDSGGVTVGSNTDYATPDGRPRESSGARKDLSAASITLKVYEGRTRRELWTGTEKVKSAFKKKSEADNVVASAEKLFIRFHDFVQPPGK